MPQSLSRILVHLVFSTKHREPLIGETIRPRLHAYLVGILENLKSPSIQTGGVTDHVHVLSSIGRTIAIAGRCGDLLHSKPREPSSYNDVPRRISRIPETAQYWV